MSACVDALTAPNQLPEHMGCCDCHLDAYSAESMLMPAKFDASNHASAEQL